jgi:hypothetical protein
VTNAGRPRAPTSRRGFGAPIDELVHPVSHSTQRVCEGASVEPDARALFSKGHLARQAVGWVDISAPRWEQRSPRWRVYPAVAERSSSRPGTAKLHHRRNEKERNCREARVTQLRIKNLAESPTWLRFCGALQGRQSGATRLKGQTAPRGRSRGPGSNPIRLRREERHDGTHFRRCNDRMPRAHRTGRGPPQY